MKPWSPQHPQSHIPLTGPRHATRAISQFSLADDVPRDQQAAWPLDILEYEFAYWIR
jgi:hypothetical protein